MQVERSRKNRKPRKAGKNQTIRSHRKRPMDQVKKLRITMAVLALSATAIVAGIIFYCVWTFSDSYEAEKNGTSSAVSSGAYENNSTGLPTYEDSFNLVLVNSKYKLPDSFAVHLTEVDGVQVEERIAVYLENMLAAAKEDGVDLQVKSGYVSGEVQAELYQKKLKQLLNSGLSKMKAESQAQILVGDSGYNEFQTGMAVVFATSEKGAFQCTAAYRWLIANGIRYGFILRYPENKTTHTKRAFEPEHFRFVGQKHATRMRELEMSLEEYANYMKLQAYS